MWNVSARADISSMTQSDLRPLVTAILAEYRLDVDGLHGPSHWLRVRANGIALARATPGSDVHLVELFALLHDAARYDDDVDSGHGERAAELVRRFVDTDLLKLSAVRAELLVVACAGHEHGKVSSDPTIGCCWDADRLDLSRLDRRPIAALLSTEAAARSGLRARAWKRGLAWEFEREGAARWGIDDPSAGCAVRPSP